MYSHDSSRRAFLRNGALSLGALAAAPYLSIGRNRGDKPGIALVGLGYYSTNLLAPALQLTDHCRLAGIVTGTPAKAVTWSEKYGIPAKNIYNYQSFDSIAGNPDIDIVYVVLPVSMHKEFTIRAANAGKHVICEKPMALNASECREMIAACKKADRLLSIGYRLHFEPHTMELIRLGKKQVFGAVQKVEAANGFVYGGDPNAWRLKKVLAGGGGLMDMGTYCIQGARYATGLEPLSVTARQQKTKPELFKEVDETVLWDMEFPGGIRASCKSSYNNNWGSLNVDAAQGRYGLDPAFGYGPIRVYTPRGPIQAPDPNQQAAQMDAFARCVRSNKQSIVAGEEGLKDMMVIDAIYRSLASGRTERV